MNHENCTCQFTMNKILKGQDSRRSEVEPSLQASLLVIFLSYIGLNFMLQSILHKVSQYEMFCGGLFQDLGRVTACMFGP